MLHLSGGGFALSTAAKKEYSDLNGKIGEALIGLQNFPNVFIVLIIIIITVIITNFASNVAVCNVLVPIAMTLVSGYCVICLTNWLILINFHSSRHTLTPLSGQNAKNHIIII